MMYLWAIFCAASLVPVLHVKKTTRFFWITTEEYFVTYKFAPSFLIIYILMPLKILMVIYLLFRACRCKFLGSFNTPNIMPPNRKMTTLDTVLDTVLVFFFGLYLAVCITSLSKSSFFTYDTILKTYHHLPTGQQIELYYKLALVVLLKILVYLNAAGRLVRGLFIFFELFHKNSNKTLRNDFSFGEHLNFFFQY